ncbi:MAG: 16S rRNA (uracil(1498)-N(3))-methyltransferase [Candidatus Thiodiazotropha sp.]
MRVHRFFIQQSLHKGDRVELGTETSHHIHQVLRLRPGIEIVLFNNDGDEYAANLLQVSKKLAQAEVGESLRHEAQSRLKIHLILAISRGERMDYAMQKATELGVSRITPIFSDRCVVKLDERKRAGRLSHWQRIVINACEQSGRCRIPTIDKPLQYWNALNTQQSASAILLDHRSQLTLQQIDAPETSLTLLAGPEGGLTGKERQLAIDKGFVGIRLGPRILRTETAPLAAIAAVQTLWGDFSD